MPADSNAHPAVCVCVVNTGSDLQDLDTTIKSWVDQEYDGEIEIVIINQASGLWMEAPSGLWDLRPDRPYRLLQANAKLPGGVFLSVLQGWLSSNAKFLTFMEAGNVAPLTRVRRQTELITGFNLAACYGDSIVTIYRDTPTPEKMLLQSKDFDADMIGLRCFDIQSMMIDKDKFLTAGGFDHGFSAGYKPETYLVAFSAVGGKIQHAKAVLLEKNAQDTIKDKRDLIPDNGVDSEMWKRIRFESFIIRAKEFYRKRESDTSASRIPA